jgi:hypothetical protein
MSTRLHESMAAESRDPWRANFTYLVSNNIPTLLCEPHIQSMASITETLLRSFSINIIVPPQVWCVVCSSREVFVV